MERAVRQLASEVEGQFDDPILAQLWVADRVRSAAESLADGLLAEARRAGSGAADRRRSTRTWEELGLVLGMSPQGVRQRHLRRSGRADRTGPAPPALLEVR
ncbi:hypothetical protein GCM10009660_08310 [Catellatospora bangladeshensis]